MIRRRYTLKQREHMMHKWDLHINSVLALVAKTSFGDHGQTFFLVVDLSFSKGQIKLLRIGTTRSYDSPNEGEIIDDNLDDILYDLQCDYDEDTIGLVWEMFSS